MNTPSIEELEKRYGALTPTLQNALDSNKYTSTVDDISERNHLSPERDSALRKIVGGVILGLIHPEDLVQEASDLLRVDKRLAEEVTKELRIKIFSPLAQDLNQLYGYHLPVSHAGPIPQPQTPPAQPVLEKPQVTAEGLQPTPTPEPPPPTPTPKEETSTKPEPSPFVIHEHQEETTEPPQANNYEGGLARPTFYSPELTTSGTPPTPAARLELGQGDQEQEPRTVRLGKEQAKVVHYSAPETPKDPFAPTPQPKTPPVPGKEPEAKSQPQPSETKKDIHPDNVVDLKDLPK